MSLYKIFEKLEMLREVESGIKIFLFIGKERYRVKVVHLTERGEFFDVKSSLESEFIESVDRELNKLMSKIYSKRVAKSKRRESGKNIKGVVKKELLGVKSYDKRDGY